jgi:hypothetical protein
MVQHRLAGIKGALSSRRDGFATLDADDPVLRPGRNGGEGTSEHAL